MTPGLRDIPHGMPQFTAQNAAEMQRRSLVARQAREERQREALARLAEMPASADEVARNKRVYAQIDTCDELLERCKDPKQFVALTTAKERLWNLVFPKAGVFRPRPARRFAQLPPPIVD